ncbi:hypothetical protein DEH81_02470 [Pectobacterium zantedeschiae]|uniref:Uncharacterized protein n=1 Tax=Pectobacterium zantedeschiae TaxID=2034769 RepID=A0A9X8JMP0_9GAMM|nr:hypothetical protein CTN06_14070 [Pectobacterium zantedeschiae]RYC45693.1 hypothetical protein CLR69_12200 [Pectobacterium zantedeschiae]RYC47267.1 hypothetical protein DEH81_02470 [Pectobacterium zantedeschiae]
MKMVNFANRNFLLVLWLPGLKHLPPYSAPVILGISMLFIFGNRIFLNKTQKITLNFSFCQRLAHDIFTCFKKAHIYAVEPT